MYELSNKENLMYTQAIPENPLTTTIVHIKYDCCGKEHSLKWKDANKNFQKNNQKHICRTCGLKTNNPASRPEVKEKMKNTNIERYGVSCPLNTKEKIAERVEKMFGDEESVSKIVNKRRETSQLRYGADHIMKTDEGLNRLKNAMQERYGVDFPLQNEQVKEKTRQTCQERYGVDNPLSLNEIRVKGYKTSLERYGVEHYNQLPEMKDYLRQNCPQWLKESYENPWAKGITRPKEWNEKQRETVMQLMDEGKWNSGSNNSLKGKYKSKKCRKQNPTFRSSYELKVHWHLDNSDDVDWYDYEPFKVAYYDTQGHKRYYIIDFVVRYISGRILAIEVKNDYSEKLELNLIKKETFKKECKDLEYETWSNKQIKNLNIDLELLLESSLIELY